MGGWMDVKSTSGKTLILVPAPEQHIDNLDITARRFFVFTANGSNVSDGRIVELIGNKYNVNDNFDLLLKNYDRNEIAGFNGSILTYDVNYHFVYSTSFSNGKKNNHDARIVTGDMHALKSNKVLAGRPGLKVNDYCTPVQPMNHSFPGSTAPEGCVFVWHQDVVTSGGCIISIHNYYLYTYCPNAGTSGTGSGSGSGSGSGGSSGNTGMGGEHNIELDNDDVNWGNINDNIILNDPNPDTEYQNRTPWPTTPSVLQPQDFVKLRNDAAGNIVNCLILAKEQIAKKGYTCSGYDPTGQTFQTYDANGVNLSRTKKALNYLFNALSNGIPVVAGADAYNSVNNRNVDYITDHFIVLIGTGTDSNGKYISFFDSSTNQTALEQAQQINYIITLQQELSQEEAKQIVAIIQQDTPML